MKANIPEVGSLQSHMFATKPKMEFKVPLSPGWPNSKIYGRFYLFIHLFLYPYYEGTFRKNRKVAPK